MYNFFFNASTQYTEQEEVLGRRKSKRSMKTTEIKIYNFYWFGHETENLYTDYLSFSSTTYPAASCKK